MKQFSGSLLGLIAFACLVGHARAELLFFDDFDYAANPSTINSTTDNPFVTVGGWNNIKSRHAPGNWPQNGSLTTVTRAEFEANSGNTGPWPGGPSSYSLRMAGNSLSGGTDFYLQLGSGNIANLIPANVYFQFWIYLNRYGQEITSVDIRHKMLYPSNNGYGSTTNKWLLSFSSTPKVPLSSQLPNLPLQSDGRAYLVERDAMVGTKVIQGVGSDNNWKTGPNAVAAQQAHLPPNQWYLVRVRFDTSDNSSGKFEAWMRPLNGAWVKTHQWIGGQDGFQWHGFGAGGHSTLRMPTTIGWSNRNDGAYYYMRDFAMASSADSLPEYDDEVAPPLAPGNFAVQ